MGVRPLKNKIAKYLSKGFKVIKFDKRKFLFKVSELSEMIYKVEVADVENGYKTTTTCKEGNTEFFTEKLARNLAHLPPNNKD